MKSTTPNKSKTPLPPHHASVERGRVARAYGDALLMLFPLMLFYWVTPISSDSRSLYYYANTIAPIYFIFTLSSLALRVLKRMPDAIWTGAFWFPIQAAIFFGFGPLVEVFGNAATLNSLSSHYLTLTDLELFRTHQLSTTGVSCVLFGFFIHLRFRPHAWTKQRGIANSTIPVEKIGILAVLLGAGLKYFVLLPAQWGSLDVTIAGVLSGLGNVVDIGFAIIAFSAASGNRQQRRAFFLLWPLHFLLTILTFAKTSTVIAILLPLIGAHIAHRSRKRLIFGLIAITFVYASLQPLVHFGRGVIYDRTSTISDAGYAERFGILVEFASSGSSINTAYDDGKQGWWTRLSFAGPQAYAMKLYDQGNSTRTLNRAWMYFIPRAVWPTKPLMVGPGLEFYRLASGNDEGHSFLGLSIYGDLYLQYGWNGVFIGSTLIGLLLATLSSQAARAIRRRNFIMLPAVLLALEIALLGPNGYVINGIIGPLPIYIAYYVSTIWIGRALERKRS